MNKKQYFGLQCFQTISHRYCILYDIVIQLFGPANCKWRNPALGEFINENFHISVDSSITSYRYYIQDDIATQPFIVSKRQSVI